MSDRNHATEGRTDSGLSRHGEPWTPDEERRLYDATVGGGTLISMARAHGRTVGSIDSRLRTLGLRDSEGLFVKPWPAFVAKAADHSRSYRQRRRESRRLSPDEKSILANLRQLTPSALTIASAVIAGLALLDSHGRTAGNDKYGEARG